MRDFSIGNFPHTALLLECIERCGDLTRRKQLDSQFSSRIPLANYLFESGCAHSGLLQLLERAARIHTLMLAGIAD
jgi:hypothetical protein